ncbi:TolC family protein [Algoriphagus vanfongensis]|uniref:TolC family protein n=1 Tax=Algoriphagus vanfongensis TaxID=426371 RepID=UPI00041322D8|nr:TolC family protein [Algoriphagus vanfongensis]
MTYSKQSLLLSLGLFLSTIRVMAQEEIPKLEGQVGLQEVLDYAMIQSPTIRQAQLDEQIGDREIKANIAGWYPQITASAAGAYNIKLQTNAIGDQLITFGQPYNSNVLLQVDQNLFTRDQLFASKTSKYYRSQLEDVIENAKINTVVDVTRAFYSILLSEEELKIVEENLERLEKQYKDAKVRYETGLVDKTDYQRAFITLTNAKSNQNRVMNSFEAKYSYLKQLIGHPDNAEFTIAYDVKGAIDEIAQDSTDPLILENRVEYRLMQTQQSLNEIQTAYEKWNYLPQLSAYYRYNWMYFNENFSDLYQQSYPTSAVGLNLSIPIFQGGKRVHRVKAAQLQVERGQVELQDLSNQINTEYETALAAYNSSLYEWEIIRENMEMAENVYDIIKMQYDEGVKAYVDLVVAETDLQTAQINHINAFYQVLLSKLDLDQALGSINY